MRSLFPLLLAGHLIGDFVIQTDTQAARKMDTWTANQMHMLTYHLTMAAFVLPVWHNRWTALALCVSWITHSVIDRRWPTRMILEKTGSKEFARGWGMFPADQALHIAILAVISTVAQ